MNDTPATCHKPIPMRSGLDRRCLFKPTVQRGGKWFCTRHDPLRKHTTATRCAWCNARLAGKPWTFVARLPHCGGDHARLRKHKP